MTMRFKPQDELKEAVVSSRLFSDWLDGSLDASFVNPGRQAARVELATALETEGTTEAAPLFQAPWVDGWMNTQVLDMPRDSDRDLFHSLFALLAAGQADIVVTGQQPGFLGGPLYTLYKVATTIALARSRSLAGKPTVPVFWSGDDGQCEQQALHGQSPVGTACSNCERMRRLRVRANGS